MLSLSKKLGSFTLLSILAKGSLAAACSVSSGVTTGPTAGSSGCEIEPSYYAVTVYEMGLCTSAAPLTAPTALVAFDASMCQKVFESPSGSEVSVSVGATSPLVGTMTRPASGTYQYGYMKIKNEFSIKASVDLGASPPYIGTTPPSRSPRYCATKDGVTIDNSTQYNPDSAVCDTSAPTAGTITAKVNDLNGADSGNAFKLTGSDRISVTGGSLAPYLLTSTDKLAQSTSTVTGLLGVQEFTTPVVVTDDSVGFNTAFDVSNGSTFSNAGYSTNGSSYAGYDMTFDSGPFSAIITVQ